MGTVLSSYHHQKSTPREYEMPNLPISPSIPILSKKDSAANDASYQFVNELSKEGHVCMKIINTTPIQIAYCGEEECDFK
jgi:hypothetical protein